MANCDTETQIEMRDGTVEHFPERVEAGDGGNDGQLAHGDAVRVGMVVRAQRERDGDAGVGDAPETRVRVAGRGRRHEAGDEGVVDEAVEVELELKVLVDDGQAQGQQVVLVGDVGATGLVLGADILFLKHACRILGQSSNRRMINWNRRTERLNW